mmetsp:Transcript_6750/g.10855  ORF Transcript_6750/g.10855 Transcript_6750/m.10855 type:complete len:163 (-) Transcript_6750:375-863(-)
MVSLCQPDGRLPRDGQYHAYPFTKIMNNTCASVFELKKGEEYLEYFDKESLVYLTPIKRERENQGRFKLKAGRRYVIVASCEVEGKTGDLYLSLYFNQALRDMDLKRVFHPVDKRKGKDEILPQLIPEEAEKLVNQTPFWKIQLVKESLAFMMSDEDEGDIQ